MSNSTSPLHHKPRPLIHIRDIIRYSPFMKRRFLLCAIIFHYCHFCTVDLENFCITDIYNVSCFLRMRYASYPISACALVGVKGQLITTRLQTMSSLLLGLERAGLLSRVSRPPPPSLSVSVSLARTIRDTRPPLLSISLAAETVWRSRGRHGGLGKKDPQQRPNRH